MNKKALIVGFCFGALIVVVTWTASQFVSNATPQMQNVVTGPKPRVEIPERHLRLTKGGIVQDPSWMLTLCTAREREATMTICWACCRGARSLNWRMVRSYSRRRHPRTMLPFLSNPALTEGRSAGCLERF